MNSLDIQVPAPHERLQVNALARGSARPHEASIGPHKCAESRALSSSLSGNTISDKGTAQVVQGRPRSKSSSIVATRRDSARTMVKPDLAGLRRPINPTLGHTVLPCPHDAQQGVYQELYQPAGSILPQTPMNTSCSVSKSCPRKPAAAQAEKSANMACHSDVQREGKISPTTFTGMQIEFHHRQPVTPSKLPLSRPTTPSALPRPTSRMSLSGRHTPHQTHCTASSVALANANAIARSAEKPSVSLGRMTPTSRRPTRSVSGPIYGSQNGIPPVPALPSQQELAAKEASRALHLSSSTSGPNDFAATATTRLFHDGARAVSMTTPERPRVRSSAGVRPQHPLDSPSKMRSPPSSFKAPPVNPSRPCSSMSSRAGAWTPTSGMLGAFIPNRLDELDKELARVLESIPTDVQVERMDPPLKKGQLHEGEWKAQYALTSWGERRVLSCRLLELTRSGSSLENKTRKVMVRDKGGKSRLTIRYGLHELTLRFSLDRHATILVRQMAITFTLDIARRIPRRAPRSACENVTMRCNAYAH